MHKMFSAAALTVALTAALTGCSGGSADDLSNVSLKTETYRGETITCVKQGTGEVQTRSCDFDTFYAAHSDLLDDDSTKSEDNVEWVEYEGKPLACLEFGMGKSRTRSCDFTRFYAAHPDLKQDFKQD